jgi:hypothetical protein
MRIRLNAFRLSLIERFKRTYQKHDRHIAKLSALLDGFAKLIAVLPRHEDVGQHEIRVDLRQSPLCLIAVADAAVIPVPDEEAELEDTAIPARSKPMTVARTSR